MASLKLISTSANKLDSYPVTAGQMIFVRDQRAIYIDTDVRTSYQQIIVLKTEAERQALVTPLVGFYFCEDTKILWEYNLEKKWIQISSAPNEQIVFDERAHFPVIGEDDVIYIDGTNIYRWLNGTYQLINGSGSGNIWIEI